MSHCGYFRASAGSALERAEGMKKMTTYTSRSWTLLVLLFLAVSRANGRLFEDPGTPVPGEVITLDRTTFNIAINDSANPVWLLKFYAPWCGHCKKLAPVLDQVAPMLSTKPQPMAIGTIDCTVEKSLCNDHGVTGYPTLKFSIDGQIHDYPGGRQAADFLQFADKLSRPAVQEIASLSKLIEDDKNKKTVSEFYESQTDDGVAYVAYHPLAKGDTVEQKLQQSLLTQIYKQVARREKAYATFFLLDADADISALSGAGSASGGYLCRLEQNVAPRCFDETQQDLELQNAVKFVRENNIPTVSLLGAHNFHKVGRSGRPLVIGVVDLEDNEQVESARQNLLSYATTGPEHIRSKYYYGIFDGKAFQRFLVQFDIKPEDLPQVFVLNVPSRIFWQNETYQLNVAEFLQAVDDGTIPHQKSGSKMFKGALSHLWFMLVEYRPWSVIFVVLFFGALGGMLISLLYPASELRPPRARPEQSNAKNGASSASKGNGATSDSQEAESEEKESKKDK